MPTILKFDGLRAVIYLNDQRPGHIHVMGSGGEARFELRLGPDNDAPFARPDRGRDAILLRENHFFPHARLNRIVAVLASQLPRLIADWRALHGRH
ncbi:hypothetical protein CS062_06115 [Roseateles chitinivorans]|jgi:hypothetical protein|uniref:DUF4160 domain-containing protein n=1 Tax=Roseateles chitinivorans TaxID=2917965 RepID=A0A2G9CC80_9BURK|nr:DUF4160 domain-containing protein [Roseateles chitinivorans]PIM54046.1 hypothetical protein CS062_06115 [Roseateles chitinivorans]